MLNWIISWNLGTQELKGRVSSATRLAVFSLLAIVAGLLGFGVTSIVYADDNTTSYHRHAEGMTYKLHVSVPTSWDDDIEEAADGWTKNTDITISEDSGSSNEILYVSYPEDIRSDCNPRTSAACTDADRTGNHILWSDIYLNGDVSFGTSTVKCIGNWPDVQETTAHEFGHAAGWLRHIRRGSSGLMSGSNNSCIRTPQAHDIESMNAQYEDH